MSLAAGFRRATLEDAPGIAALMAKYYSEEGYPFDSGTAVGLVATLVAEPRQGQLWVVEDEGRYVAYLAVTLGFSFEHGGVDAFIDELFVARPFRGRGIGRRALSIAVEFCAERRIAALHLEVEPHREHAAMLYRSSGFVANGRRVMTRRVADPWQREAS